MPAIQTLEMRWFEVGVLPKSMQQWFEKHCPGTKFGESEEREDLYFRTSGCDAVNLKLRQGKLELKWRSASLGVRQLGGWEGQLERWLKWSYSELETFNLLPARERIFVKKRRSQRVYCDVACELTQLEVNSCSWWSIGFEMPETQERDRDFFEVILRQVSQTHPNLILGANQSSSYPRWLQQQETGDRR